VGEAALDIIGAVTYRAVFFDAGETLLSPHPSFPELLVGVLNAEGHAVSHEDITRVVKPVTDRFLRAAEQRELWSSSPERSRRFWRDIYSILLGELGIPITDELFERLYATFTTVENYRLFPDVEPTLAELHDEGLTLGVISNFEEWLERLLGALNVTRYFAVRVISGAVGYEKPDPEIFRLALKEAGVRAGESAYVGDNPYFDIEPAAALGMHAILLDRRHRYEDHAGPRIGSLAELPALLKVAA
jgi:putative hydrolase of the HAD superfamily